MKLESLTTHVCDAYRTNWVFVKVTTDTGVHGWGEATLEYRERTVEQAVHELKRGLRGRDLGDIEAWWQDACRDAYWRGGPVLMSALSSVEMALWDIKGKALGVPVYALFGGKVREAVPCYANGWFAGATTPEEFADTARRAADLGYSALKWDPFGASFRTITSRELRAAMTVVEAVDAAVGDRADLIIEAHGRFELPSARRVARALEDHRILWLEEPLIPGNLENYARLRAETRTPLGLGERLYTRSELREVLERGCADYVQPDVSHVGGIAEMRRIAALAETWQVTFCPHNPSGPVANAATVQLAATVPNFVYLETMATDVPWRTDVAREQCRFDGGALHVPDGAGLGVDIDERALTAHPYQTHDLRHYSGALTDIRPATQTTTFQTTGGGR